MCIRLRSIRAKTQLSRLANGRCQSAVQLWVTTAAGPSPAATHTGPASRWRAGVSAAAAPRPACPGRSRPAACGHRTATPVVSAMGEAGIARQLMPGYLQAPGPRRSSLTLAKNNRGPAERPYGRHGRSARRFLPLAAARALMYGAQGKPVLRHGAGQAGAIDDGLGFDLGHGAEHVSDRAAGHSNQHRPAPEHRPCRRQKRTFTPRAPVHKYTDRPLTRWTIPRALTTRSPVDNRTPSRRSGARRAPVRSLGDRRR